MRKAPTPEREAALRAEFQKVNRWRQLLILEMYRAEPFGSKKRLMPYWPTGVTFTRFRLRR